MASLALNNWAQYFVYILFARNWQPPFLNQQKEANDHRNYFMINLHESVLAVCKKQLILSQETKAFTSHWTHHKTTNIIQNLHEILECTRIFHIILL